MFYVSSNNGCEFRNSKAFSKAVRVDFTLTSHDTNDALQWQWTKV